MSSIDKLASELNKAIKEEDSRKPKAYDTPAQVLRIDEKDTNIVWVHIPGGIDETPIKRTINAKPGDVVQVRVSEGNAWITGNASNPPTDDTTANRAAGIAINASEIAEIAVNNANRARDAADAAVVSAGEAKTAAEEASTNAGIAKRSADESLKGLGMTQEVLDVVNWVATHGVYVKVTTYVEGTSYYTITATEVTDPTQKTDELVGRYYEKNGDIYVKTDDTHYDDSKTYYNVTGTPVTVPKAEDIGRYYTLNVKDAMGDYIQTHLAVTNDGLYVMADDSEWKVLIADDGVYIINPEGENVAKYKDAITIGKDDGTEGAQIIDYHSLRLYDRENMLRLKEGKSATPYLHVSDLRDNNDKGYLIDYTVTIPKEYNDTTVTPASPWESRMNYVEFRDTAPYDRNVAQDAEIRFFINDTEFDVLNGQYVTDIDRTVIEQGSEWYVDNKVDFVLTLNKELTSSDVVKLTYIEQYAGTAGRRLRTIQATTISGKYVTARAEANPMSAPEHERWYPGEYDEVITVTVNGTEIPIMIELLTSATNKPKLYCWGTYFPPDTKLNIKYYCNSNLLKAFTFGNRKSSGTYSFIGPYSVVMGRNAAACGSDAISLGNNSVAQGNYAISLGGSALGDYSFAVSNGEATGQRSSAIGPACEASNQYAIAIGRNSKAKLRSSVVIGIGLSTINGTEDRITAYGGQFICGCFNDPDDTNAKNAPFVVGVGTGNSTIPTRRNGLILKRTGDLSVYGAIDAKTYTYDYSKFGYASGFTNYSTSGEHSPKACKFGKVVNLSGVIKATAAKTGTSQVQIGTVPTNCKPLYDQHFWNTTLNSGVKSYRCTIKTDGKIYADQYTAAIAANHWFNISATYISANALE